MVKHNGYTITQEMKDVIERVNTNASHWREAISNTVDVIFKKIPESLEVDYDRYLKDQADKNTVCTCTS